MTRTAGRLDARWWAAPLGGQGARAIREIFARAATAGIIPTDPPAPVLEPAAVQL